MFKKDYERMKATLLQVQRNLANSGGVYGPAHDALDRAIDALEDAWSLDDWDEEDPAEENPKVKGN